MEHGRGDMDDLAFALTLPSTTNKVADRTTLLFLKLGQITRLATLVSCSTKMTMTHMALPGFWRTDAGPADAVTD